MRYKYFSLSILLYCILASFLSAETITTTPYTMGKIERTYFGTNQHKIIQMIKNNDWETFDQVLTRQIETTKTKYSELDEWDIARKFLNENSSFEGFYNINDDLIIKYLDHLEYLLKKNPHQPCLIRLYLVMLQRYDIDSQTRFNKGIPILEATILQYPDHPEPLLLTAMFHFQCNKESQSIPYFEKGITLLENNPKLQKSGLRMSISILASCYAQDSQYDKVQGLIKKLEPSGQNVNPDDYLELGKLYEIIKDYSTALNYYQKAAGGNPTKRDNLGIIRCQTRLNQDQAVDSTLQDYFVTHNDLASKRYMYEQLFHNYDDINQCERAAEYYHKYIVVSMDSSRRDSDLSRSLILYGNKPGHLERYTDYFRKRVKQDSEDWISWGILAGLCYYQGISPQGLEKKYH